MGYLLLSAFMPKYNAKCSFIHCFLSVSASHTIQNPAQTFRSATMGTWLHGLSDTSKRAIHINLSAECRIFHLSAARPEVSLCEYAPVSFVDWSRLRRRRPWRSFSHLSHLTTPVSITENGQMTDFSLYIKAFVTWPPGQMKLAHLTILRGHLTTWSNEKNVVISMV